MISFIRNLKIGDHKAPALFTASSIWLSVAQMASGIILVHYVAPREMGLWSSVSLALTYSIFLLAGIQNGLSRELPYYLGADKEETANRLASATLAYTLAGCLLVLMAGLGVVAYLIWAHAASNVVSAVATVTLLVVFQFYQYYLFVTYRSKSSFVQLAAVQTWQGLIMLLSLPLLVYFGFRGMLLRAVLVAGLSLFLMHRVRPMRIAAVWSTPSLWLLVRTGIPIFLTDYVRNVAGTFDRVALLRYATIEQVGLYSLAATASAAFQVVPQSVAHYIYPRMSHHYGRTNDSNVLWGMAWKITLVVIAAMLPLAIVGSLILPTLVKLLFPKYIAGTRAAQILLFSATASGATIGSNALSSLKAWSHLLGFQLSYAAIVGMAPFVGIRFASVPLLGVAYGVLFANLVGVALAIGFTYAATRSKGPEAAVGIENELSA